MRIQIGCASSEAATKMLRDMANEIEDGIDATREFELDSTAGHDGLGDGLRLEVVNEANDEFDPPAASFHTDA